MGFFYLLAALLSQFERLSFVRDVALFALFTECLSIGALGGVRRALMLAPIKLAKRLRATALYTWAAASLAAFFVFRGAPGMPLAAVGALLPLLQLLIDMRGMYGPLGQPSEMRQLLTAARAYTCALLPGALPLALYAIWDSSAFGLALASAGYLLLSARGGRLSDIDSEKRVAIHAIALCLPMMFMPAVSLFFEIPRHFFLMAAWPLLLAQLLSLSGRRLRYGLVLCAFEIGCALTLYLPRTPASALSAALALAMLFLMKPCLYGFKLSLNARKKRRSVGA